MNGQYGGANGTGGLEGVSPYLNSFNPVISDARGNVLAEITNGVPSWTLARPTGYGAVPGYRPVAFGNGVDLSQSSAWRGHEVDVTGYYHLGLRDYDPVSGQWLSYDPTWNDHDPNGQSFCGGDPVNGFDSRGKCVENLPVNANISINPNANLGPWLVAPGTDTSLLPQPYVNSAQPFTFTAYFPNDVAFQQNAAGVGQIVNATAQVAGVVVPFVLTDGASAVAEEEAADEIVAADTSGTVASTEATTAASTSRTMTVNPSPYQIGVDTTPGANSLNATRVGYTDLNPINQPDSWFQYWTPQYDPITYVLDGEESTATHEMQHAIDIVNNPQLTSLANHTYFPGAGFARYWFEYRGYSAEGALASPLTPFNSFNSGQLFNFGADVGLSVGLPVGAGYSIYSSTH